jgi:hypothetical protein
MAYAEGKSIRGLVKERTLSGEEILKIASHTGEGLMQLTRRILLTET